MPKEPKYNIVRKGAFLVRCCRWEQQVQNLGADQEITFSLCSKPLQILCELFLLGSADYFAVFGFRSSADRELLESFPTQISPKDAMSVFSFVNIWVPNQDVMLIHILDGM